MKKPNRFGERPILLVTPRNNLRIVYPHDRLVLYAIGEGRAFKWYGVISYNSQQHIVEEFMYLSDYDFLGYL